MSRGLGGKSWTRAASQVDKNKDPTNDTAGNGMHVRCVRNVFDSALGREIVHVCLYECFAALDRTRLLSQPSWGHKYHFACARNHSSAERSPNPEVINLRMK